MYTLQCIIIVKASTFIYAHMYSTSLETLAFKFADCPFFI